MDELEVKTGHDKKRITEALLYLEKDNYIVWENKTDLGGILIIEGWERESDQHMPVKHTQGTADYWTKY
ncbi:hypothetical protein ACFSVM_25540 [Paenibacillus shunpengii]|uniref:Uncharacterized protein n=1 Tax=Paenibacillus shunpengii TaxID=2054424 RepID=A0ABW5SVI5_9BACL